MAESVSKNGQKTDQKAETKKAETPKPAAPAKAPAPKIKPPGKVLKKGVHGLQKGK